MSDVRGRPLDFSRGRTLSLNSGVVATNGILHRAVLEAVRFVLFPEHSFFVTLETRKPPTAEQLRLALAKVLQVDHDTVSVQIAIEESDDESESVTGSDEEDETSGSYETETDDDDDDEDDDDDD